MNRFSVLLISALFVASAFAASVTKSQKKSTTVTEKYNITTAAGDENNYVDVVRQSHCNSTQFQCTSGQCINKNLLCNERNDCYDGSDESNAICYISRPTTTQRYPGGIPLQSQAETNDKPPASTSQSKKKTNNDNVNSFSCRPGEFACTSGECIEQGRICDGYGDCSDGSDEATTICPNNADGKGQHQCLSSEFRCDNGQCVFAGFKCDGKAQCTDSSDEDWAMCQAVKEKTTTTKRPTNPPNNNNNNNSGNSQLKLRPCQVPFQPANGRWRLHRSLCDSGRECNAPANVRTMDPGSYLVYACEQGFTLNGTRDVLCGPNGQWIHEPKCDEIRCPDLSSSAIEAFCVWNNVAVSCEVPAPVGTTATLKCRKGFVQEVTYTPSYKNVTCAPEGNWTPQPVKCVKKPKRVKLVLEGDMIIED